MIALLGRSSTRATFQQPLASQVLATSGMAPLDACWELRQCYLVNENNPVERSWLCPCRGWFRLPSARAGSPVTAASSNWGAQVYRWFWCCLYIHEG